MSPKAAPADQNYLLRGIDPAEWARFRARADAEGIPMRTILLQLATAYADGAIELRPRTLTPAEKAVRTRHARAITRAESATAHKAATTRRANAARRATTTTT